MQHATIEKSECPVTALSIVPAPVFGLKNCGFKHTGCVYEVHAVLGDIDLTLGFVLFELHSTFISIIVNMDPGTRRWSDPSMAPRISVAAPMDHELPAG